MKTKSFKPGKRLTAKQKAFADKILANPFITGKQAAQEVYNPQNPHTSEVIAYENLRKPDIMIYLNEHAVEAEKTVYQVMKSSRDLKEDSSHATVALRAASDILDRVHGKPTQRTETVSTGVTINIDLSGSSDQQV